MSGADEYRNLARRDKPLLPMRPEDVVLIAIRKLGKRTTVVAGLLNRLITFSTRSAPPVGEFPHLRQGRREMFKNVRAGSESADYGVLSAYQRAGV